MLIHPQLHLLKLSLLLLQHTEKQQEKSSFASGQILKYITSWAL